MLRKNSWRILAILELVAASLVILFDVLLPTVVILGIVAISLLIRREGLSTLGFIKREKPLRMVLVVFLLVVVWSLFQLGIVMPVLNRLTGTTQDLSAFADLQGNLPGLLILLALTWTLAAFGEEVVYRGFLQRRVFDLLGTSTLGVAMAIGFSSILFGVAHMEQGVVGVVLTFLDAVFFSLLKLRYSGNLWASILAHGFSNTLGLVAFYLVGPIYGLW
jgi:hypothetical protein